MYQSIFIESFEMRIAFIFAVLLFGCSVANLSNAEEQSAIFRSIDGKLKYSISDDEDKDKTSKLMKQFLN